jgi:hypothetical protein
MNVNIIEEHGYETALLGLSLSFGQDPARMPRVASRLRFLGDGHNKFLESIMLWLDVTAARYFWQQFDTYRVGVSKQSESTMHTMTAHPLGPDDFEHPVPEAILEHLNALIAKGAWEEVKWALPESFLQRRIVCLNYMALQRIIRQRRSHRLEDWQAFIAQVLEQAEHPELLEEERNES